MLRHLRVKNFAIISDVALDLGAGLNALTGETGAGKSLIVDAVNLLRGGRASADIPRAGADEAVVEAIFHVPEELRASVAAIVRDAGLPEEDGELLVRRVIHRGGRSRTYVNGALTTASRLGDIGRMLVDLSGQHQHQGLVDPRRHRAILDAFACEPALVSEMRAAHARLRDAEAALAEATGDPRAREDRIDYLRFQLDEIDAAALKEGEEVELAAERRRLEAADRLESGARLAEELVYAGDGAAVDRLGAACRELARIADIDGELATPLAELEQARAVAEEAASTLRRYADRVHGDPDRLAEILDRLEVVSRLERKHGGTVAEVLARAAGLRGELDRLTSNDRRVDELEARRAAAEREAARCADALTAARRRAAARLERDVRGALAELGMTAAELSVLIEPRALAADGGDRVEFLLAPNRGEPAKPLARIASGGELSRIMLALKLVLRRADEVAVYVFDEVDAGIGGATAEVVGRQIRAVARERQVLCVTHLPQIAAFADVHLHVSKIERGGRTETVVTALDGEARREEMARMLGGVRVTRSARAHADEMLRAAADGSAKRATDARKPARRGVRARRT